jgi:hypothetical protein
MWNSLWKTGKKKKKKKKSKLFLEMRLLLFLPPWLPVTLREDIQGQLLCISPSMEGTMNCIMYSL